MNNAKPISLLIDVPLEQSFVDGRKPFGALCYDVERMAGNGWGGFDDEAVQVRAYIPREYREFVTAPREHWDQCGAILTTTARVSLNPNLRGFLASGRRRMILWTGEKVGARGRVAANDAQHKVAA
jgi:hypothetical protein